MAHDYEFGWLFVIEVGVDGRLRRIDFFDTDQLDDQGRTLAVAHGENAAMAAHRRWVAALVAQDWDTVGERLHPDVVLEDVRPMLAMKVEGRDTALGWFREIMNIGLDSADLEVVAMRGERLALSWFTVGLGDFEARVLNLVEGDDAHLGRWVGIYAEDQLDDALAELERRFVAGKGAPHASWLGPTLQIRAAHARRDWDAPCAPSTRRTSSWSTTVPRAPAPSTASPPCSTTTGPWSRLRSTHRQVIRRHHAIGDGVVLVELVSGSDEVDRDVGAYETVSLLLSTHDADGRTTHMERFTRRRRPRSRLGPAPASSRAESSAGVAQPVTCG